MGTIQSTGLFIVSIKPSLVGGIPTPLKNMSSSVGMMTFPTEWKNKNHVPNHQPDNVIALMLKPPTIRKESECQSHSSHGETQILLNNPIRFIKLAKKGAS
jgi:hypothetical protein